MINQELHLIANEIVGIAVKTSSIIVVGSLKGIRKSCKGRKFNRIVHGMPHHKLARMIEYKAGMYGIQVIKIKEAYTSKTCSRCSLIGKRRYQGLFKCSSCSYEVNADFNAAKNILKRSLDYMFSDGAYGLSPKVPLPRDEGISTRARIESL